MLRSRRMYDICFRALQGLPLPARSLTTFLIESIMGRLIATEQVILCNYVWMANHLHMQIYSLDSSALKADLNTCVEKEVSWVLATDIETLAHRNPSWSLYSQVNVCFRAPITVCVAH
jgi:hypothetical protein